MGAHWEWPETYRGDKGLIGFSGEGKKVWEEAVVCWKKEPGTRNGNGEVKPAHPGDKWRGQGGGHLENSSCAKSGVPNRRQNKWIGGLNGRKKLARSNELILQVLHPSLGDPQNLTDGAPVVEQPPQEKPNHLIRGELDQRSRQGRKFGEKKRPEKKWPTFKGKEGEDVEKRGQTSTDNGEGPEGEMTLVEKVINPGGGTEVPRPSV